MDAAIARAEPIDYPAEPRGLNFFELDVNLRRLLWRRAPGLLDRHGARLGAIGPEPDPDQAEIDRLLGDAAIEA